MTRESRAALIKLRDRNRKIAIIASYAVFILTIVAVWAVIL